MIPFVPGVARLRPALRQEAPSPAATPAPPAPPVTGSDWAAGVHDRLEALGIGAAAGLGFGLLYALVLPEKWKSTRRAAAWRTVIAGAVAGAATLAPYGRSDILAALAGTSGLVAAYNAASIAFPKKEREA